MGIKQTSNCRRVCLVFANETHIIKANKTHKKTKLTGSFDEAPLVLVCHERCGQHSANTGDRDVRWRTSS